MQLRGVRVVGSGLPGDPGPVVDVRLERGVIREIAPGAAWRGAWVMPGLWDHHVHATEWARAPHRLDLSSTVSPQEVLDRVEAAIRSGSSLTEGGQLVGTGLWHSRWERPFGSPSGPTRADLDAVTGDLPTVLISADLHSAWFNSAAARAYELPGGEAEALGSATATDETGLVVEEEWFTRMPDLDGASGAVADSWVREAGRHAAARGIVGIVDFDAHDTYAAWQRRLTAGFAEHRVRAAVWPEYLEAAIGAHRRTGDRLDAGAAGLVEMGPLKVVFDGSLNTRTAWCHDPYPEGTHGSANLAEANLRELMSRASAAGIDSAIHAIGDRANSTALDAFGATGARGSIEHAQLLADRDVLRMRELGVRASVQPAHLLDDRDVAETLWAGRTHRAFRFADLYHAGVRLRFGSDAPVAPLDPWLAIAAATNRTAGTRPPWHGQQRLERAVALTASTAERTLAVGGPADLVVLGADPLAVPSDELPEIPVLQTVCAGRVTFEA